MCADLTVAARAVAPVLAICALASCSSVDPVLQAKIDAVWEQPASEAVYENGEPRAWEVGQWVQVRIDFRNTRAIRTVALTKKEGSAWWLEFHDTWPDREVRAAILLDGYRPHNLRALKIRRILVKGDDGEIADLDDEEAGIPDAEGIRDRAQKVLDSIRHLRDTGRVRDVTVPAGVFKDTLARPITLKYDGDPWSGYVWYSNAVPLSGFVRVAIEGRFLELIRKKWKTELVAFGDEGVKSAFFE